MKITTFLAGSAATCAIAGVLVFVSPVWAQGNYGDSGPQYSTPAEQEQTRTLNQQGMDGTTQPAADLNGEQQTYGNPQSGGYGAQPGAQENQVPYGQPSGYYGNPQGGSYSASPYQGGAPSAQQQQYDSRMQQYGQQQQDYQDQQQRYQSDSAQYRTNLRAYDRAMYDWGYPAPVAYEYDGRGLQPLYLIAEPSQQLYQLPVEGPNGRWVGRVRNVEIAPGGRPARVEVALNRRVSVWVAPDDLRYDGVDHVLFTDLTRENLWQLPGATIESGPM